MSVRDRPWTLLAALPALCYGVGVGTQAPAASGTVEVAVAARSIQPGELIVFTLTLTDAAETVHVRAFNRELPAFHDSLRTWRALVGIDLGVVPRVYPVTIAAKAGTQWTHTTYDLRVERRHFPVRALTVDKAFVNPPRALRDRIAKEAVEVKALWTRSAPARLWMEPFVAPVPGEAVSGFGVRSIFNGKPRNPHGGADFSSPAGTPIVAPNAGRVVFVRDLYFSGNTIIIDHGLGLFSLLAHLSAVNVQEGDMVVTGQAIGRVGATGRVTGPHLHWAVRAAGARIDPLSLLALLGGRSPEPVGDGR